MRSAALLLLLLAILPSLAPPAAADHVYSHRYLFVGRVVDDAGRPVPNATVQVVLDPSLPLEGPCGSQPRTETAAWGVTIMRPVTNALGEFMFCYHVHVVPSAVPPQAALRVQGMDATERVVTLDPDFRASYVVLRLPSGVGGDNALDRTATLAGRVWQPQAGAVLEGVPVNGLTVNLAPVNLTFSHDGVEETLQAATNNYGDFAVRVNLSAPVRNGTLTVESMGKRFSAPYHPEAGIAYVKANLSAPGPSDGVLTAQAPVLETPRATPGPGLALGAAAVLVAALLQRRGGA